MADPRAFVSFDYDHDTVSRILFVGQAKKDSPTPFTVHDWSSKSELPEDEWEDEIRDKVGKCNMAIVLVGNSMSTATGVVKEIAMSKELDVPIFGVYVNGAGSTSTLPTGLARSRCVYWKWQDIADMVDQMMTEGKNADE